MFSTAVICDAFLQTTRMEALKRHGSSFDEKKFSDHMKESKRRYSQSNSTDMADLISFDSLTETPLAKNQSVVDTKKEIGAREPTNLKLPKKIEKQNPKGNEEHEEFLQLFRYQLVGLFVTGWVRKSLVKRISGVQVTTVATGALGYLANKGNMESSCVVSIAQRCMCRCHRCAFSDR